MKREEQIQQILTYLTFAEEWVLELENEDDIDEVQLRYIALPLAYFNGAELGTWHEGFENLKSYETMMFDPFHPDNKELQTMDIGLWQHCGLYQPDAAAPKHEKATCLYHIGKYRKMQLSEVRGRFKLVSGDLVEWSHAWVYNNGSYQTIRTIYERRGEKWWAVGQPLAITPTWDGGHVDRAIFAAKSMAFSRSYEWRVEIGFQMPGRTMLPTVAVPTDPQGAKTAYRLRDIPAGKSRRDALRHWVSTHWRKDHYSPEEEIKIWAHLRGVEEFSHNGLKCRIVPSEYDLKKAAEYQKKQKEKPHERRKVS